MTALSTAAQFGRREAFVSLMCDADLDRSLDVPAVDRNTTYLTPVGEVVWPEGLAINEETPGGRCSGTEGDVPTPIKEQNMTSLAVTTDTDNPELARQRVASVAHLLAQVPERDRHVVEHVIERCPDRSAEDVARSYIPAFPVPAFTSVPCWAWDMEDWKYDAAEHVWERLVTRDASDDSPDFTLDVRAWQSVDCDGTATVTPPFIHHDLSDDDLAIPERAREIARCLLNAADLLEASAPPSDEATLPVWATSVSPWEDDGFSYRRCYSRVVGFWEIQQRETIENQTRTLSEVDVITTGPSHEPLYTAAELKQIARDSLAVSKLLAVVEQLKARP